MDSEGWLGNVGAPQGSVGMCRSGEPGEKPSEPSGVAWSWDLAGSEEEDHPKVSANEGHPKDAETGWWQSSRRIVPRVCGASPTGRDGGELRPKGPTGGQATPGRADGWEERWERR